MSTEPFLPFAMPDIGDEEIEAVVTAMRSGWLTTGPAVAAFEREFAEFLGDGLEAVAVNSATAGLHLALEALGIGPGDEVIVPTWTFTATAEVVRYLGAEPVLVDVDEGTLNIDLEAARRAISDRTKAIMPVHFAGLAVDQEALARIAREHGLAVVEDAAHAFPARSGGSWVGDSDSAAVVFSFYATKTITTGEGGMIVTRDPELAARARTMRLHGISRDVFDRYRSTVPAWHYEVVAPGYKYNLTDPAAAMGRVQLRRARQMRDRRAEIAGQYTAAFRELELGLPDDAPDGDLHAWHLYPVRIRPEGTVDRDTFISRMAEQGVGCSVHFIPLHQHPYWRQHCRVGDDDFPVASRVFPTIASLPIFASMTSADVVRVVTSVGRVLA